MQTFGVHGLRVALSDFGMSRKVGSIEKTQVISPRWAAPELVRRRVFTLGTDLWALGT